MSGLIGALSQGLSQMGYAAGDMYAKQSMAEQAAAIQSERDKRLAEMQEQADIRKERRAAEAADRQRTDQRARIDAEAGKIADEAVGAKRGLINAGRADAQSWTDADLRKFTPADWTPAMQAAVDQSLAEDRKAMMNDTRTRTKAAVRTGDLSIKDAEAIDRDERRIDATNRATDARERQAELRAQTQEYIANLNAENAAKRLEILAGRMANGGADGTGETLKFLDGARKILQSDEANIRQPMMAELAGKSPREQQLVKDKYKPQLDAIAEKRKRIEEDFEALREKVGLPPREGAKPKAEPGKSGGDRRVGQTQVVQSGPHKGKTVEWDGKGWRLK